MTSHSVVLRAATPDDDAFVIEMARPSASSKIGLSPTPMTICVRCSPCGDGDDHRPGHNGTPVGAVWAYHRSPPLRTDAAGVPLPELCVAVAPAHRGAGIGGALLDGLFAELAKDHDTLVANVHTRHPAMRLYERKGFRVFDQGNGPLGLAIIKDLR